jgi:hypothetical protein
VSKLASLRRRQVYRTPVGGPRRRAARRNSAAGSDSDAGAGAIRGPPEREQFDPSAAAAHLAPQPSSRARAAGARPNIAMGEFLGDP